MKAEFTDSGRALQARGQVLSEYAIMLAMFAAVSISLLLVLACFSEYGWRLISLVAVLPP